MTTLADRIREGASLYVNCGHPACCKSVMLDLELLALKLGPDHGCMHYDLVDLFVCSTCEAEGRDRRKPFFTHIPNYQRISDEKLASGFGMPKPR